MCCYRVCCYRMSVEQCVQLDSMLLQGVCLSNSAYRWTVCCYRVSVCRTVRTAGQYAATGCLSNTGYWRTQCCYRVSVCLSNKQLGSSPTQLSLLLHTQAVHLLSCRCYTNKQFTYSAVAAATHTSSSPTQLSLLLHTQAVHLLSCRCYTHKQFTYSAVAAATQTAVHLLSCRCCYTHKQFTYSHNLQATTQTANPQYALCRRWRTPDVAPELPTTHPCSCFVCKAALSTVTAPYCYWDSRAKAGASERHHNALLPLTAGYRKGNGFLGRFVPLVLAILTV